jgi:hypothetical protein
MAKKTKLMPEGNAEIAAISVVYAALKDLDGKAQVRVLSYVSGMLNVAFESMSGSPDSENQDGQQQPVRAAAVNTPEPTSDAEGINSVALRLMKRSGIEPKDLDGIFSLGIDEIDLVAPKIPGHSKREKFHNVLLLKGIASYLGTGTAKVTHEQLKETSLHYGAFDATNAAGYLKAFSADFTGSKTTGYTLSPRGLTLGINMVKAMLETKKA